MCFLQCYRKESTSPSTVDAVSTRIDTTLTSSNSNSRENDDDVIMLSYSDKSSSDEKRQESVDEQLGDGLKTRKLAKHLRSRKQSLLSTDSGESSNSDYSSTSERKSKKTRTDYHLVKNQNTTKPQKKKLVSTRSIGADNDTDESFSDCASASVTKSKIHRIGQKYCKKWESELLFKGWLTEGECKNTAKCKICNCQLKFTGGKTDLLAHYKSSRHRSNSSAAKIQQPIATCYRAETDLKKNAMLADLRAAAFVAEHNVAFLTADHLTELQKTSFPDSKIATSRSCSRTKTTALVKNVIGLQQYEDVADLMRKNKFGICIDESTDISTTKNLSIVVRIAIDGKIRDLFFDLLKVELADAVTIYNRLVEMFEKSNINYKSNLIGFAADGAAVMTGKNHSVAKLLRNDCPNLVIIKCVCHSMALCASYACKKLPSVVEKMAKNIYNYIQNSPKRVSNFEKICTILESGKPKKILHPSQTRWLSLESVVNRLLEMYNELLAYFTVTAKLDDADNGEIILEQLNDPVNNLYLKFLQFILPQINKINRLFQSESAQIHKLNSNVKTLLFSILDCL